jgi:putative membrane protein
MSEPTSPDDRAVGPPEHLHPLFLLSGLTRSLRSLGGAYALIAWLAFTRGLWVAVLAAFALLLFGLVGVVIYWSRFEFRVGEDEIRIDHGIVSRTHRSIPFDRIQDVDITQGPLQRLLGLAKVTFETGGGSAGRHAEEGALQTITLERAEQIRTLVRSRGLRAAVAPAESAAQSVADEPVYAMSFSRLLLAGVFNFSLAVLGVLFGLTQTVGDTAGFDPLSESFWRDMLSAGDPVARYAEEHRLAAAVAGALLLVLIGLATGIVRTIIREFGFRLDRSDVGLRRRRGLFTRTDVTLPVRRAQAVVVDTGPVRDRFGWRELKLQSLASDEQGKGNHVLAPLATDGEVNAILAQLGWRRLAVSAPWRRISLAYVSAFAIALSPLFLLASVQALFVWPLAVAYVAGLLAVIALRWLAWRRTAFALVGDRLLVRAGWWRRTITILPIARIQSIDLSENFITRWFGTASLRFGVAGGGSGGHTIPANPRAEARELRDELLGSPA